jgi:hypothetical protein
LPAALAVPTETAGHAVGDGRWAALLSATAGPARLAALGEDLQVASESVPRTAAQNGFAHDREAVPQQDGARCQIVHCGLGTQMLEAVVGAGQFADAANGLGGDATAGEVATDAVTELGAAAGDVDEIDPPGDRILVGEQDVEDVRTRILKFQEGGVPGRIVVEEVVATIGNGRGEVVAVDRLEVKERVLMLGGEPLQLHVVHVTRPRRGQLRRCTPRNHHRASRAARTAAARPDASAALTRIAGARRPSVLMPSIEREPLVPPE